MTHRPIDDAPLPPPQIGRDANYITRDLEHELESAMHALVDEEVRALGIGRRDAAVRAIAAVRGLVELRRTARRGAGTPP